MREPVRFAILLGFLVACGSDPPAAIEFSSAGSLGPSGAGSFRFGAASAATQIEDMNPSTDWYLWSRRTADGGLGKGLAFVADATKGYSKVTEDLALVKAMGLDSYRFSIEWARIEPMRDQLDEAAIAHYRTQLETMKAMGIRPLVTLHHFSNPVWIADPRDVECEQTTHLCGLGAANGAQVVAEMAQHAGLIAARFGDLVDEWGTLNEPMVYLLASYGLGQFPPGRVTINDPIGGFVPVVRDYVAAHAAMYKAIKANDTVDADGDGSAAIVGLSMSVADWEPSRASKPSQNPDDIAARDRLVYVMHYVFVDSAVNGTFDANLDGVADEDHPEWRGTLDWLGLQYYFRGGVTGERSVIPVVNVTPCFGGFDLGACLQAPDPTYCAPRMGYEAWHDGIAGVIEAHAKRYPQIPLVVSESGIATDVGARRAETIVRILEAMARTRDAGVDLRGYYYWSLTDNFEWAEGFGPHFGLYAVDYGSYGRTPTDGVDVLSQIATSRTLTTAQRERYGGTGSMTREPGFADDPFCYKVSAN